ncbi:MAG: SusD/RagB family nutrient-binding outer membrane lipoprotein [Chitinophagaceae bacterium]
MKKNKLFIIAAVGLLAFTGCKKFLDINKDPNNPLAVKESLLLTPIEITISTNIVGGFNGTSAAYWMQQMSINQPSPDMETYRILPADVDNTWSFYLYPNVFENLDVMINQAKAAGHNQYAAIGKTLFAYGLAVTTDLWNNIPYSQALQVSTIKFPKYDSQEAVYAGIQKNLDSALYYINQPASAIAPAGDDFIYGGDMKKWKKYIYMLKARYYLRLTRAPGRTASLQADSALTALANGFTSNDDNAAVSYPGTSQAETPWYQNTLPGAGGVVMAKSFIDSLIARNDPRLPILADTNNAGVYAGRPAGVPTAPDPSDYSSLNTFYGGYLPIEDINDGSEAPLYLATYSEALFIKAEATFIKQGAAAAQPVYQQAIGAHMSMLGIKTADQNTYIASRPALTAANAIEQIITEKYVADFLSIETYNDWRRTGFPVLTLAANPYVNYIPRRWPYSQTEVLTNPQPDQSATIADRVWWDPK